MSTKTAKLSLWLVTLVWGTSYIWMKIGLAELNEFNLLAWRFLLAFVVAALFFYRQLTNVSVESFSNSVVLGALLFLSFVAITFGVGETSAANAGFIVGLTVVFIPLIQALYRRSWPARHVRWSVVIALSGISLLSVQSSLTVGRGDVYCFVGALSYALYMVMANYVTKRSAAPIVPAIGQLAVAGGLALLIASVTNHAALPAAKSTWLAVVMLGVFCSALGFIGQTLAQRHTTATEAGFIFALEPVFAAAFAVLFMHETLSLQEVIGGSLLLVAVWIGSLKK